MRTLTYAVALELLQRSSSLEYASMAYKHSSDRDAGNNRYNLWQMEELVQC
jgi:hypothetical protein